MPLDKDKILIVPPASTNEIEDFTKAISELIKNIAFAGDSLEFTSDQARIFAKEIQQAAEKMKPEEIAETLIGQLQEKLEKEGKKITIPNLVKKLKEAKVSDDVTAAITEWAKQRNQYVIGVKSLAEELGKQLMTPFEKMTDWIEKIPGGKLLHKAFGFDNIKKKIQQNITDKLAAASLEGGASLKSLQAIGVSTFESMGGAATAMFAHPVLLAIALIIGGLYLAWKQWNKTIEAAKVLRDATGLTGKRAKELSETLVPIASQYTSLGVDMEILGKTTGALINEFQTANILTEGMKTNAGILAGAFGVTEQNAAKVVRLFKTMGVESDAVQYNLQASITNAADLAGVGIDKTFDDLAQSSKEIHTYFKGNVKEAAKTVIELRRMGTTLKEAAASAKSMLDFESNVGAELEASVLLGRQLDFSAARYYAFIGDIEKQQKEVLKQVGSIEKFNKLMPFQKEAIAKAAGMEVDQLANILEQQKLLASMNPEKKRAYEDAVKQIGQMNKKTADSILLEKQRLLAQEKFAKIWNNILYTFSSVLFPIFDAIYEAVDKVIKELQKFFASKEGTKMLQDLKKSFEDFANIIIENIPTIIDIVKGLIWYFTYMIKVQTILWTVTIKFMSFFIKLGEFISDAIFRPTKALKTMIVVFQNLGKAFAETWLIMKATIFQPFIDIFGTIIDLILKVGGIVIDILLKPFELLIDGVKLLWKVLQTGWDFIYKVVFQPWLSVINTIKDAWNFITNPFGIFGGNESEEAPKTATGGVITKPQVRMVGEAGPEAIIPLDKAGNLSDNSQILSKLDELITKSDSSVITQKLDELIKSIQSISIVMDHRKVGEILATNTSHPGLGG